MVFLLGLLGWLVNLELVLANGDACPFPELFHPAVEIRSGVKGWGVFARAKVEPNTTILRVPLSETISSTTFNCRLFPTACDVAARVRNKLQPISHDFEELSLAAYLSLDNHTLYSKYALESAPEDLLLNDKLVESILQPLVPELATRQRVIKTLVMTAFEEIRQVTPLSIAQFVKALAAVTSRSFYLNERNIHLVPCGDLFNHASKGGDATVSYRVENNAVVFRSRRVYEKDQEIFISYGDKSHIDLGFQYGFYIPSSPSNYVLIPIANATQVQSHPVKASLVNTLTSNGKIKLFHDGLQEHDLQLLRAIGLQRLSSWDLANILGRGLVADDESELNTAKLLERLVFEQLSKYKHVLENNEIELPELLDGLLTENIRILAKAWNQFHEH